jgi:hypothetical protein
VERFFHHHVAAGADRFAVIRKESEAPAHASTSQQQPFHLETSRGA